VPHFLEFHHGAANFPWRSQAKWIGSRLAQTYGLDLATAQSTAAPVFRSDLFRDVLGGLGADMPGASEKIEGSLVHPTAIASADGHTILPPDQFFDGKIFDPIRN
jgi:NitT/TauT family transport system ATP-binding protein